MNGFDSEELWEQIWSQKAGHIAFFSVFLLLIILIMVFRDRVSRHRTFLDIIRYCILAVSFLYGGLVLKAQPTTANIVIFVNALKEKQLPLQLFVLEPFIFLSFIFILVTIVIWGRGVFCGWLCPYGAMLELLNRLREALLPAFRLKLPEKIHWKLIYLKYAIFIAILAVSFYDFVLSEYLVEIEPFRTLVLKLKREWYFVLYFGILTAGSVVVYRAFCRYLCPLGGALAIPSLIRKLPLIRMRRYDFCSTCKICPRACRPNAIGANGVINSGECLNCLDCQVNFWDEDVCPALIRRKREAKKPA